MNSDPMDVVIGTEESAPGDPQAASKHLDAARQADKAGDRQGALAEYRRAVSADPANQEALFQLAYALDLLGEEDEAFALYERAAPKPQPRPSTHSSTSQSSTKTAASTSPPRNASSRSSTPNQTTPAPSSS